MQIIFENDFQQKILHQRFSPGSVIATERDVLAWRSQWMGQLKSWHSPYKTLVDVRELTIAPRSPDLTEGIKTALERNFKFFEGLFLKKAVAFGRDESKGHGLIPIEVLANEEEAQAAVGVRNRNHASAAGDFRSLIQLQNHFKQHTVELNFADDVHISDKEQLQILKSKLSNNLMQWHSKWNLLVDCSRLSFHGEMHADFGQMLSYFKGLFLKNTVGYMPKEKKETYPFPVFRSRHLAAQNLEMEGAKAGDEAICQTTLKQT